MHFLYLDDSGSPKNPGEEHFVFGGVIVPEESLRWLSSKIEFLAQDINPSDSRSVEFHAAECFRAVEFPWKGMVKPDRIKTIKSVLGVLKDAKPSVVLLGCAIHKASFPGQDPVLLAFEDLSSRFNQYLEHKSTKDSKQRGVIVIDKSSYELGLQNLASEIRQSGNHWGSQLRSLCEVPLFIDSKASRLIQLADHIAYAIHRRYNQGDITYFNCIEDRFDQYDGKLQGLAHKQFIKEKCTCPACLTKNKN